ncbi:MAG: hypothetical protein ACRC1K_25030 [Planctomycetia bacterium]
MSRRPHGSISRVSPPLLLERLEPRETPASLLELVKDLDFTDRPTTVGEYVEVNGSLFLQGTDAVNGSELWRYRPDLNRFEMTADIAPGDQSSSPSKLTNVAGTLYFTASEGFGDVELWKSDGTKTGTVRVADIRLGFASNPEQLTNVGGVLYFTADDGTSGRELWRTSASGVERVADLYPVANFGSRPQELTNVGGVLFFTTTAGAPRGDLWRIDGASGVTRLLDFDPSMAAYNDVPQGFLNVGGLLYFAAGDATFGRELWKSDGAVSGTGRVADVAVGTADAIPNRFTNVGGVVYFSADDGTRGRELWRYDAASGARLVANLHPAGYSNPYDLVNVGGVLFFTADDGSTGRELWKSGGAATNTVRVRDVNPGSVGGDPSDLVNVNGVLYFAADDGSTGRELWKSGGESSNTVVVKDVGPGSGEDPQQIRNVGGVVYFTANDSSGGVSLWKVDGPNIKQVGPLTRNGGDPQELVNVGGVLYFTAEDAAGRQLWRSDGNPGGTFRVTAGAPYFNPRNLTSVAGVLYFSADDGVSGRELWKTDGSASGTVLAFDLTPGPGGSDPGGYGGETAAVGGTLFFNAFGLLWKSDGTRAGTQVVYPGDPRQLTNVGGVLYFSPSIPGLGRELWKTDGTTTELVKDLGTRVSGSYPGDLTDVGGVLYFTAFDDAGDRQLWKSDGTASGTTLVPVVRPGSYAAEPNELTNVNGTLYFSVANGLGSLGLWKSDGAASNTVFVAELAPPNPGLGGRFPRYLTNVGGVLYFAGAQSGNDVELWRSDGTAAGTGQIADIQRGRAKGLPRFLAEFDGSLYFNADDGRLGAELWAFHPDVAADPIDFVVAPASGPQGTPLPLNFDVALLDRDGSETLTVTISGVPSGSMFTQGAVPVGTLTGSSVWTFTGAQIPGLTFVPPADFVGEPSFFVVAVNVDDFFTRHPRPGRSVVPLSTSTSVKIELFDRVALPPIVTAGAAPGFAGAPIPLAITARSADTNGSETITAVTISGLPEGAVLTANNVVVGRGPGTVVLTSAQLAGLTLTLPKDTPAQTLNLTVSATVTEEDEGATATSVMPLSVTIFDGFPEPPTLAVLPARGFPNQPIPLSIAAALVDLDGSQTLKIFVRGVPTGAVLSAGSNDGAGTWTLTAADLAGLTLTPPFDFFGEFSLTVTANGAEGNAEFAETARTLDVEVLPPAESRPIVTLLPTAGLSGEAVPLGIRVTVPTGQAYRLIISGVPGAVLLTDGFRSGSAYFMPSDVDLVALRFLAPAGLVGDFLLTITAANDETGAESAPQTLTVSIRAPDAAVAAAPTVTVQPASGVVGRPIPLAVGVTPPAGLPAGRTVRVRIDNVPAGAVLSAGAFTGGGSWVLTPAQTVGLTVTLPATSAGLSFSVVVAADVVDAAGQVVASSADFDLAVTAVRANTAPRFGSGRPRLAGVTSRNGLAVRSLLVGAADGEQRAVGAAVVGLTNAGRGRWQFKTTGAWKNVAGRLSDRRALLLPASARLRFVAARGTKPGRLRVKLRAWDQTTGAAATFTAAAPAGGSTAFSATARTVTATLARAATSVESRAADRSNALDRSLLDAVFAADLADD